jgi:hypothetical protein
MCNVCTYRQSSDCNVTCHMIEARHKLKNILFNNFVARLNTGMHLSVTLCYYSSLLTFSVLLVCDLSVCLMVHYLKRFWRLYLREVLKNTATCISKFFSHSSPQFDCRTPQKESNISLLTFTRLAVGVFFQLPDSPVVSVLWFLL